MTHLPSSWKKFSLATVCKFVGGGTPSMGNRTFWENGTIPWVSPKDMKSSEIWNASDYITEEAVYNSSTTLVPSDSILVVTRSGILKHSFPVVVNRAAVAINQDIKGLIPNGLISTDFLAHKLRWQSINILKECSKRGTTVESIDLDALKRFEILIPPVSEQKTIENLLNSWDRSIDLTEKLIAAKTRFKRGLMQQLLTGRKRFPDFASHEWKPLRISDFAVFKCRAMPKPKEPFKGLGIRSHGKGTFLKPDFEPQKIELDELYQVKADDLIVNITFAWEGAIAIAGSHDEGALVSHRFPTYEFKEDLVTPDYFRHVIVQKWFVEKLSLISPGGAGRNRVMSKKDFGKIEVLLPPIEEQRRIASVLEAADREIEILTKRLELLKLQKKGLMQKLLTGEIRVKVEEPTHAEASV